jgi:hypothetical protein
MNTTALQDLLEKVEAMKSTEPSHLDKGIYHYGKTNAFTDVILLINSLMPKDRETHDVMGNQGARATFGLSYQSFEETFPTHPTNK